MTVINANRLIMGRLASIVAQKLLAGEEISIVNAENAIISGSKIKTIEDYVKFQEIGTREWGPYFPKRPDRILKRTVRGMLPY
ncbi:50S ribosomal protein L13, partial [Methanosalsum natronophilum]